MTLNTIQTITLSQCPLVLAWLLGTGGRKAETAVIEGITDFSFNSCICYLCGRGGGKGTPCGGQELLLALFSGITCGHAYRNIHSGRESNPSQLHARQAPNSCTTSLILCYSIVSMEGTSRESHTDQLRMVGHRVNFLTPWLQCQKRTRSEFVANGTTRGSPI